MKRATLATEMVLMVVLVALCVAGRLLPHPEHFTPVAAAALFAGYFLRSRWLACCVPLAALAISDQFLEGYNNYVRAAGYIGMCFPVLMSLLLRKNVTVPRLVACSAAGSVFFFLLSNFAVWKFGSETAYSPDLSGLLLCYTKAIPFFRNMLCGDLIWTSILFALHGLIASRFQFDLPEVPRGRKLAPIKVRK